MAYRLSVQLESDAVCLSDNVRGTVTVDVSDALHQQQQQGREGAFFDQPAAVRLLICGVESGYADAAVRAFDAVVTVIGPPGPGEAARAAALLRDVTAFTTLEARNNPLPGVAMPVDGDGGGGGYTYLNAKETGASHQSLQEMVPANGSSPMSSFSPPPSAAAAAAAPLPQEWTAGGHYEYPFSFSLPPWLPPSYCYKPGSGKSEVQMQYKIYPFIAEASDSVDSADSNGVNNKYTKVMLLSPPRSCSNNSRGKAEAKGATKKSLLNSFAAKPQRKDGGDAGALVHRSAKLDLPAEAAKFVRQAGAHGARELIVLSGFPRREYLQCMERISIPPPFSQKLLFHLYKRSLGLTGLSNAPFTDISVRLIYESSAAVVLRGRPATLTHVRAALGLSDGSAGASGASVAPTAAATTGAASSFSSGGVPAGLTVTGTVVSQGGDAHLAAQHAGHGGGAAPDLNDSAAATAPPPPRQQRQREQAPPRHLRCAVEGVLRLRVKVRAGSVSISKVRVELMERVRLVRSADAEKSVSTFTLASYTYKQKIRAKEACEFVAALELPEQFRHTSSDSSKLPPPAGVTTAFISTATWLQVTFPDLHAVPEKLLDENIVMVAEDVDLTETLPFLPSTCDAALRHAATRSAKQV